MLAGGVVAGILAAVVGPPWLSVLSFTVLALFQGLLTVAALALVMLPSFVSAVSEIT